jgi:hypothetical protein
MNRIGILIPFVLFAAVRMLPAQTYRTYTGWGNNLNNPLWGANGDTLVDRTTPSFGNGYSSPAGQNRQNARRISNFLAAQPQSMPSQQGFSDFVWVFGQLIDHEFALVHDDPAQAFPIFINFPDPQFNPGGVLPAVTIPLSRSAVIPGTGTEVGNPRRYANVISAFFDGSVIYGSDSTWADWLRTFQDGKMKTSTGNLLPFNTVNGEFEGELDPNAPRMDNQFPVNPKLFVAGDIRVNENVFLTAMHTLFVREHNLQCERIKEAHPDWNDEQIYQHARKVVSGIITAIAYEEWLPTLGVPVPPYLGYDPAVHPGMFNVFSAAAFRLGHTFLSTNLPRRDNLARQVAQGDILLRHAFFNPVEVLNSGGVEPMLKGMAHQMQQNFDHRVVDDVRNFLFGPPGAGGRDLIAINIQRGRERGLADFNTIRFEFGLSKYTSFMEMFDGDEALAAAFQTAFGSVDNVDAWIGLMAEPAAPGSTFGSTLGALLAEQFANFRDGDRFYYEIDPDLSTDEIAEIKATRLYDVLMRNTDITVLQKNVFLMEPHEVMCGATELEAQITGDVAAEPDHAPMSDVAMTLHVEYKASRNLINEPDGTFDFGDMPTCRKYHLTAHKEDTWQNGVSIADIILLNKHLLGSQPLSSPYLRLAADVNGSSAITIADMIQMRHLLLGRIDAFDANVPWLFFNRDYVFQNPNVPGTELGDAMKLKIPSLEDDTHIRVLGVKIGDLNGSAALGLYTAEPRLANPLVFQFTNKEFLPGQSFILPFTSPNIHEFAGFQMSISYPTDRVTFKGIVEEGLALVDGVHYLHFPEKGLINIVLDWNSPLAAGTLPFSLAFEAKRKVQTRDVLRLTSQILQKEAVTLGYDLADINLRILNDVEVQVGLEPFQVFGNQPNPFNRETVISFELPEAGDVEVVVYDLNGRQLLRRSQYFYRGYNQLALQRQDLAGARGILIYQLNSAHGSVSERMIITD